MKINFKVRAKNPQFWITLGLSILTPVLAYYGISEAELTTWAGIGALLVDAVSNPYVMALIGASVYNALIDPTTKGVGDSERALEYDKPGGGE